MQNEMQCRAIIKYYILRLENTNSLTLCPTHCL